MSGISACERLGIVSSKSPRAVSTNFSGLLDVTALDERVLTVDT
jgi:hypothetical protein